MVIKKVLSQRLWKVILCFWNQKQPPEVFYKKSVVKSSEFSQENTCVGDSFNTYFEEHLRTTASLELIR